MVFLLKLKLIKYLKFNLWILFLKLNNLRVRNISIVFQSESVGS